MLPDEEQKQGIFGKSLDDFLHNPIHYNHVHLRGLMTIGPALDGQEMMRPFFRSLRLLNERIGCDWLSMGMSGNSEVAIQEGSPTSELEPHSTESEAKESAGP